MGKGLRSVNRWLGIARRRGYDLSREADANAPAASEKPARADRLPDPRKLRQVSGDDWHGNRRPREGRPPNVPELVAPPPNSTVFDPEQGVLHGEPVEADITEPGAVADAIREALERTPGVGRQFPRRDGREATILDYRKHGANAVPLAMIGVLRAASKDPFEAAGFTYDDRNIPPPRGPL